MQNIADYCLSFARGIYVFMWIFPRQWRWAILQSVSIIFRGSWILSLGRYITAVTALYCGQHFLEAADASVLLPWMQQGSYELRKFSYNKKQLWTDINNLSITYSQYIVLITDVWAKLTSEHQLYCTGCTTIISSTTDVDVFWELPTLSYAPTWFVVTLKSILYIIISFIKVNTLLPTWPYVEKIITLSVSN